MPDVNKLEQPPLSPPHRDASPRMSAFSNDTKFVWEKFNKLVGEVMAANTETHKSGC